MRSATLTLVLTNDDLINEGIEVNVDYEESINGHKIRLHIDEIYRIENKGKEWEIDVRVTGELRDIAILQEYMEDAQEN